MSLKIEPSGAALREAAAAMRDARDAMRADMRIGGEPGVTNASPSSNNGVAGTREVEGTSFGAMLEQTANAASAKEHEAVAKAEALAQGRSDDLHGTMITMKEADISMKLVGSVRDKLMDAFHELWRINV